MSAALTLTAALPTAPSLQVVEGRPMAHSVDVAEFFGKRHNNVLRDIASLCRQIPHETHVLNFEQVTESLSRADGSVIQRRACLMTRDGFTLLAMGFTGKRALQFKLAYIEAFNRMEAELRTPRPVAIAANPHITDGALNMRISRLHQFRAESTLSILDHLAAAGVDVSTARLEQQVLFMLMIDYVGLERATRGIRSYGRPRNLHATPGHTWQD